MMHDIQMMMMAFNFYNPLPIEYIRPLLICVVEEYLYAINSNERVRPYLHNYPFTPENVEIIIQFLNRDGSFLAPGEIEIAKAKDGQLIYTITDVETQRLKDIHEESFEEALRICRNQDEASLLPQETVSQ